MINLKRVVLSVDMLSFKLKLLSVLLDCGVTFEMGLLSILKVKHNVILLVFHLIVVRFKHKLFEVLLSKHKLFVQGVLLMLLFEVRMMDISNISIFHFTLFP